MTRKVFAACILSLAFAGIGNAQEMASSPDRGAPCTQAQLKKLARSAHSPDQFQALAAYYGERQKNYLLQAAKEKKEWERLSYNTVSMAAKYPRPVDSARNAYEYYMAKASESGAKESEFRCLAAPQALSMEQ
jgi:hypothetical protein